MQKHLATLLIILLSGISYASTFVRLPQIDEEETFYFIGRSEPIVSLGQYVPMCIFRTPKAPNYYISLDKVNRDKQKCFVSLSLIDDSNKSILWTWETKFTPKVDFTPESSVSMDDVIVLATPSKDKIVYDILYQNEPLTRITILAKKKLENFKEVSISKAAPLWKWDPELLFKF